MSELNPEQNNFITEDTKKKETNLYPIFRYIFLIACAILTLALVLFLIYLNGKSLYDHGI